MEVGGQRHAPAALPSGNDPVLIVQEAGWAPGPVWTGAEKLAPTTGTHVASRWLVTITNRINKSRTGVSSNGTKYN